MMSEKEQEEKIRAERENRLLIPIRMIINKRNNNNINIHDGCYNLPTVNEIAVIFEGEDGRPPSNVDIQVYPKHQRGIHKISYLSSNSDPMSYPLLFPYGERGKLNKLVLNNKKL